MGSLVDLGRILLQHQLPFGHKKKTPYEVVYGQMPPNLLDYVPGTTKLAAVEKELKDRDHVLGELRDQLKEAQARMKQQYDSRHNARNFKLVIKCI